MKITITQEFDNADDAYGFMARLLGPGTVTMNPVGVSGAAPQSEQPERKPRKPRSDAGQPRGPNSRTTGQQAPGASATPTKDAKAEGAGAPSGDAGGVSKPTEPTGSAPVPSAAPSAAASEITLDQVRAKLHQLHAMKGQGVEASLAALQTFKVMRVSDLPKEKYAEFMAHVDEKIKAAGK